MLDPNSALNCPTDCCCTWGFNCSVIGPHTVRVLDEGDLQRNWCSVCIDLGLHLDTSTKPTTDVQRKDER